jgi:hypothetical protein
MAFEPTSDEGVTRSNRLWPRCCTSSVLHRRDINKSEPTRQHDINPSQHDDGHAKLTNGKDHVTTV